MSDIALLKLEKAKNLTQMSQIQTNSESAISVPLSANPFGLGQTVTSGIVSAVRP